jgi:hypothetical protein
LGGLPAGLLDHEYVSAIKTSKNPSLNKNFLIRPRGVIMMSSSARASWDQCFSIVFVLNTWQPWLPAQHAKNSKTARQKQRTPSFLPSYILSFLPFRLIPLLLPQLLCCLPPRGVVVVGWLFTKIKSGPLRHSG